MGKFDRALIDIATWFERQKRVLPWRSRPTLYRVWISEIMLQQTQVKTVLPYFDSFINRFPDVRALAKAREQSVLTAWSGLGYYSRARNLHRGAREIVRRGGFPRTKEDWLEIPGVGPYTAGAIVSIALDQPEPILDGNIERVLSRLRRTKRDKARLWKLSQIFVERAFEKRIKPSVLNQSLMELGATICTPKKPACLICPLKGICRAAQTGDAEDFPPKKKRQVWKRVEETVYCLRNSQGEVLLEKQEAGKWRAGLWDFPGKLPKGFRAKLERSIRTQHVVTNHKIQRTTKVYTCAKAPARKLKWIHPDKTNELPTGSALQKTLKSLG